MEATHDQSKGLRLPFAPFLRSSVCDPVPSVPSVVGPSGPSVPSVSPGHGMLQERKPVNEERRMSGRPAPPSVLVVEDEPNIRELVALHLRLEEMSPVESADGREGLEQARARPYDLIILDLMLPGLDGVTVCRAIRRESVNTHTPILMLTARREESDKVVGLDSGADDYLTKPFGIRELMARVRALLRRGPANGIPDRDGTPKGPVIYKHIEADPARRMVRVRGVEVDLTFNEFELLLVLIANPGIVFSREALLSRVWKDQTFVTVRSVDTLVKRLRKKIERTPAEPEVILTVWGAGYKAADVEHTT
jgi:DNA-binding response OmpR family regulator